nr:dirigent protein 22-like [Ziziphus jujuba var. spinosa]
MAKLALMLSCLFLGMAVLVVHSTNIQGPKEIDEWFKTLNNSKEKLTRLHFYFHDAISGKNPTAVKITEPADGFRSPTSFGQVNMIDNLLTEGPEPDSKPVGRAQGLYAYASMEEFALLMVINFVFTGGDYNGSSLAVLGRNPVRHQLREMPIIGGTGVFRLARGSATARTYSFELESLDAIVEYDIAAIHY